MMSIRKIALALIILALTSCSPSFLTDKNTTGTKVDQSTLNQFQKGKSTYADVTRVLGEPASTTTLGDGTRVAVYNYTVTQSGGIDWTTLYGGPKKSANYQRTSAMLNFDSNGILKDYSTTQSQNGM